MKIAAHKLSVLADQAGKKLHGASTPALTLSDSADPASVLAPLSAPEFVPGRAVSGLRLSKSDVTDVIDAVDVDDADDVTDVTDVTDISDVGDTAAGTATLPSGISPFVRDR